MKSKKIKPVTGEKLTPSELLHKRMENPDYQVTNDDIKNLKIGPEADENIEKEEAEKLEEIKKEKGKNPPNPYTILGD